MPRKKPYSGKQKKKQLQEKKLRREGSATRSNSKERWTELTKSRQNNSSSSEVSDTSSSDGREGDQSNFRHTLKEGRSTNPRDRYRLNFLRESQDDIAKRKKQAQTEVLSCIEPCEMEQSIEEIYQPGSELDMPQRPPWKYGESKEKVERREEEYFHKYLDDIYVKFQDRHLSYFEHNLETWRQLWRVLEMSDILVMVADVRHPVLHFSPALYNFAVQISFKPLILVLNKIDLVPAPIVVAWKRYFEEKFPQLHVVTFTSFPKNVRAVASEKKVSKRRPVGKRIYSTQIGPKDLLQICRKICGEKVNLDSWEQKINYDLERLKCDLEGSLHVGQDHGDVEVGEHVDIGKSNDEKEQFKDGKLTLGFVGHPNVGKSSLMNGLIGKKVVSTSVTPGHTKYFQTYFLTSTVRLCDCPGLVFPSLVKKQMQILSGIYPVSQVQEPYTPVGYLASRIPVIKLLGIVHPNYEEKMGDLEWTAWDICEAWAEKRKFYTAKGRRSDVYRAANNILRMAVDGRLCMFMLPPSYIENEKNWVGDPETTKLLTLTSDPESTHDLMSFQESFGEKDLESAEHDSSESESSGEDNDDLPSHGDGQKGFSVQNKFALLDCDD